MLPIFSWDYDPKDDEDYRHQIRAENLPARVRMKRDMLVVDVAHKAPGADIFGHLADSIPGQGPFVLVPHLSLQRDLTLPILQMLLAPDEPLVEDGKTSFLVDVHGARVLVNLWSEGEVEIFLLYANARKGFPPGSLAIETFTLNTAGFTPFDAPPVPLNGAIKELRRGFWKKINPKLSDPWLPPRSRRMHPRDIGCTRGSIESLNQTSRTLISTWMALHGHEHHQVRANFVSSGADGLEGGLVSVHANQGLELPEALGRCLKQVFIDNRLVGYSVQTSIGSKHRKSGYLHTPIRTYVSVDFDEVSAHEIMEMAASGPSSPRAQCAAWMRRHHFSTADIETLYGKQD